MAAPSWLEHLVLSSIDRVHAHIPRPVPSRASLESARVIAHRGAHQHARENTLAAFTQALEGGCWGIEFDVRWTYDKQPVIHHDTHLQRVFADSSEVCALTSADLRSRCPDIPSLEAVLRQFGRRVHLLIEIKPCPELSLTWQKQALESLLDGLEPVDDYHLISLDCDLLAEFDIVPTTARIPIATVNARSTQKQIERQGFGGLLAPYGLCPTSVVERERMAQRIVGTGFIDSENVLRRELNRNVQWLFSNNPIEMAMRLNRLRATGSSDPFPNEIK